MTDDATTTHYELLGVEPDAPKDDIRAAYQAKLANVRAARTKEEDTKRPSEEVLRTARDEEAKLRSAWQVLSDPVQRDRYDQRVGVNGSGSTGGEGGADFDEDEVDEDTAAVDVPARPARSRRPPPRRCRSPRASRSPPPAAGSPPRSSTPSP